MSMMWNLRWSKNNSDGSLSDCDSPHFLTWLLSQVDLAPLENTDPEPTTPCVTPDFQSGGHFAYPVAYPNIIPQLTWHGTC